MIVEFDCYFGECMHWITDLRAYFPFVSLFSGLDTIATSMGRAPKYVWWNFAVEFAQKGTQFLCIDMYCASIANTWAALGVGARRLVLCVKNLTKFPYIANILYSNAELFMTWTLARGKQVSPHSPRCIQNVKSLNAETWKNKYFFLSVVGSGW